MDLKFYAAERLPASEEKIPLPILTSKTHRMVEILSHHPLLSEQKKISSLLLALETLSSAVNSKSSS